MLRHRSIVVIISLLAIVFLLTAKKIGNSMSDLARRLVIGFENLSLTVYKDRGGAWTIGYGHLVKTGEKFYPYGTVKTITQSEAEQLLDSDMRSAVDAVSSSVKVALNETQKAALVSLAFNIGNGAFKNSTLLKKLNNGDYQGAADQFSAWVYDNGVKVSGLVNRRNEERRIFLS